jgi:hypothetical protein
MPSKQNATVRATSKDNTTVTALEQLVENMAAGQTGAQHKQQRSPMAAEDAVIMEGDHHRKLASCSCQEYRNGASSGSMACAKVEGGKTVCYPAHHNGRCNHEAVACRGTGSTASPLSASPAPTFFDAEEEEQDKEVYLNINLQLVASAVTRASQLPDAKEFAKKLADVSKVSKGKVEVVTSFDGGSTSLHATIAFPTRSKRETAETQLQLAEELTVKGLTFTLAHMQVYDQTRSPMTCNSKAEGLKADAGALLARLVALKEEEVMLLGKTKCSDCAHYRSVAASLGAPIQ